MVKLKELVNPKKNSRNNQISFDVKKLEMRRYGLDVEDILNIELARKLKRFRGKL